MTEEKIKGRHVLFVFVGAFSIIIGVNMTLAVSAVKTFPGLEVKNSYVASQFFEEDRAAQEALGWEIATSADGDMFRLAITDAGGPVFPEITRATLGRATHVGEDQELAFSIDGTALVAPIEPLGKGNWNLRLAALADDGTEFKQRIVLRVAK